VISLAYLADVFGSQNSFNISLQDVEVTILEAEGKVPILSREMSSLVRRVKSEILQMLLSLMKSF
jgi:hypothetical protein